MITMTQLARYAKFGVPRTEQPRKARYSRLEKRFVPGVCCDHKWKPALAEDAPAGAHICFSCGAKAVFENSRLVEYDAHVRIPEDR